MAKPNYSFEKRQRDLAKKKKKEEKLQKKAAVQQAKKQGGPTPDSPPEDADAPQPGDAEAGAG